MRSMRVAATLGITLALVGGPALGAPKRACNLVTDPRGDGGLYGQVPPGTPAYPTSLDILSADIASNNKQFTAVIRVDELVSLDPGSPTGIGYAFNVTVNKQRFALAASRTPGSEPVFTMSGRLEYVGDENNGGATYGLIGLIDGVFDEDASEIRMTAPLTYFTPKVKRGARFDDLRLWSYYEAGYASDTENRRPWGGVNHSADRAESRATYAAGSPSCVKVGH
ncbi:MAG TPA: hypothetical protein VNA12_07945 [Mycobacteriales bacterium]|nr:hypothetical protein [Mycobacteriales bacterium]